MADLKISAAADVGTPVATDKVPLARSGSTTAYYATIAEIGLPSSTTPAMDGTAAVGTGVTWARADHVHPSDTSRAPLASPTFTGTPAAPTAGVNTNTTQLATTAFVLGQASGATPVMDGTAAAGSATAWARGDHVHPTDTSRYAASNPSGYQTAAQVAAAVHNLNAANNTGFAINQRGYVSGTVLASGAFGHDRWKGGGSGGTYTFTQSGGPSTTITITAGSLQQVVEGAGLLTGSYMLSWSGTAQGRVGGGSYAASPVSASLTAGTNATIEFNAGTLGQVKLEPGSTATPWQGLDPARDLQQCQRFYVANQYMMLGGYASATGQVMWQTCFFPVTLRATPTLTFSSWTYANGSTIAATQNTASSSALTFNSTATGLSWAQGFVNASAEL